MSTYKNSTLLLISTLLTPALSHSSDLFGSKSLLALTGATGVLAFATVMQNENLKKEITTLKKDQERFNDLLDSCASAADYQRPEQDNTESVQTFRSKVLKTIAQRTADAKKFHTFLKETATTAEHTGDITPESVTTTITTKFKNHRNTNLSNQNLNTQLIQAQNAIKEAELEIAKLREEITQKQQAYDQISQQLSTTQQTYNSKEAAYQKQIQDLQQKIAQLQQQITELQLAQAQHCPERELEEAKNQVSDLTKQLKGTKSDLTKQLEGTKNDLACLKMTSVDALSEANKKAQAAEARADQQEKELAKTQRELQNQLQQFSKIFAVVAGMAGVDQPKVAGFTAKIKTASQKVGEPSVLTTEEQQLVDQLINGRLDRYFAAGKTTYLTTRH